MAKQGQSAAPAEYFGPTFPGLEIGSQHRIGEHVLTVREIAKHFGNWQVRYHDSVDGAYRWEQVASFRKMVFLQEEPA